MQYAPPRPDMQGGGSEEYERSPFETSLYYIMVGSGYVFTALRYGWVPLCVVLGASSLYCPPAVDLGGLLRGPPQPPPPPSQ